jgi:subtilisin family serine protease
VNLKKTLAVSSVAALLITGLSLSANANPGNSNSNSANRAAPATPARAAAVEVPAAGRAATENLVRDIGRPDFAMPGGTGAGGTAPGSAPATPGNPAGSAPGANPSAQGKLTPPGLTRRIDTPAAGQGKLKNGGAGCEAAITAGPAAAEGFGAACETQTYLVLYRTGSDLQVETRGLGNRVKRTFTGIIPGVAAELTASELAELAQFSTVASIEPDGPVSLPAPVRAAGFDISATQTSAVWGLDRLDQAALPLNGSYTYESDGAGVRAFVVDTGMRVTHNQYSNRVQRGFTAINDGRGVDDCNGHGTHVAGTIGGSTHGVAKAVSLVPVRVLDCNGSGSLSGVVAGLNWIGDNVSPGERAVVNMSLGGGASSTLDAAVQALIDRGVTVVVAAGNSSANACNASPARVPGAITVAASGQNDSFASFSNFGSCVDVIAPGVSIVSTWNTSNTATATLSGTSMASPHVAGLVAQQLALSYETPVNTSGQITSAASTGVITGVPGGTPNLLAQVFVPAVTPEDPAEDPASGDPIADEPVSEPAPTSPGNSKNEEKTKPVAPGKVKAKISGTIAEIIWSRPPDGGAKIIGQWVRLYVFGELVAEFGVDANATSLEIKGLQPGVGYVATVTAVNALGLSPESLQSNVIRPIAPQGPTDGAFQAWVKRVSATEAKIYVKYPQLGQKVQLLYQNGRTVDRYLERGWVRVLARDLNEQGHYVGLQNEIYFVRTVTLEPGKNRLRIMVDGVQFGRTITYSR